MGYVIRGKVAFLGRQRRAVSRRATPLRRAGTTPILYAGTEVAEVSPSEELGRTLEVVTKNMEEMEASA
jgi:hypothetical protein